MTARGMLPLCGAMLVGCGSQFADPILTEQASQLCSREVVLELQGASYATIPRLIQDDFTIEMWIRTQDSATGTYFWDGSALVFADVGGEANDFSAAILNDRFMMLVGTPNTDADTDARSTSNVTTGEWVHVAATRSRASGVVLAYVDGVLEGTASTNDNSLTDAPQMTVGGREGGTFYTGLLSEIRLWSRVRSQAELVFDMRRRLRGNELGLVALFHLDDGSGEVARDAALAPHDALFTAPVSWVETETPFCTP